MKKGYSLTDLAKLSGSKLIGDGDCVIDGVATLSSATSKQVSFLANPLYKKQLATTKAGAVVLSVDNVDACRTNALVVANPYLVFAKLANTFAPQPTVVVGLHPTATIGTACSIDDSASIGPNCVLGNGVQIGAGCHLGANCVLGDNVQLGKDCRLAAGVTLYHDVCLGHNVILHSGVVVGSDGFGFANDGGTWHKVPQLGTVIIGNNVEIGANSAIDRGSLEDTVIDDGVKIDNLVQIAHNVRIGAHTIIAGCVGIAGSTVIGSHCALGGASGIGGHLQLVDGVQITGMSMVTGSINSPGVYSSGTGIEDNRKWRKNAARFHRLDQLAKSLKQLEKDVDRLIQEREM